MPWFTDPLVWIDCEMTGLDPEAESILQIACFVTDYDLNLLEKDGFEVVIHHSAKTLEKMGEWCQQHHGDSGLTKACVASEVSHEQAATRLLEYIQKLVPKAGEALLAGNSVHADKAFLAKSPYNIVLDHLHYRILDVSSIKEAAKRWAPNEVLAKVPPKLGLHEARQDIIESIEEARFYRDTFFKQP
ncbi:oligoribonuclease-like protein [Mytilinidion resinicola]|uniref:Oligoribonuclease-like protein n=1 Tax=Mytilinidion resinicola TaxID=574789 RepID=A0A6A6YYV8_9PEZI|nr:oligoribonuclease-like protein [Mytilinidion resinicola]KAF2814011.1 oligoribonuclease-like protein [Mytilinidion resinicola]